jgi:DNA-directed RNA polymerase subunit N (RpoN/RPB10)
MIPVRCFTCGKVLGNLENKFDTMLQQGKEKKEIFEELRLTRYCCKMVMISYI